MTIKVVHGRAKPKPDRRNFNFREPLSQMKKGSQFFVPDSTKSKVVYARQIAKELGLQITITNRVAKDGTHEGVDIYCDEVLKK